MSVFHTFFPLLLDECVYFVKHDASLEVGVTAIFISSADSFDSIHSLVYFFLQQGLSQISARGESVSGAMGMKKSGNSPSVQPV